MCDPANEDCREILLDYIRSETSGIDVAFWFMEDSRFSSELIRRAQAGVPVRVLMDTRPVNSAHAVILQQLADAGIPMRRRTANGILHWKTMIFAAQRIVQFSGANYSADAFVYVEPYRNYVDEGIYFTGDPAIVQSFMRRYDDVWTDTVNYANYANVSTLRRNFPTYGVDPSLNFPPGESFRSRSVATYNAESTAIDAIIYRITDRAHSDAMIAAVNRGVRVRIITEPQQYRDPNRLWHSWNVDRMYMAGVQLRHRAHQGLLHQKSVLLHGQRLTVFGSSNWTSPSTDEQEEHNYFTTKASFFDWFNTQFDRKWNNRASSAETTAFVPLAPDTPALLEPANGATRVASGSALVFNAGLFAHLYDIYFGTTPNPPLLAANVELGPSESGPRRYQLPALAANTTYYWRIVAKTMAMKTSESGVWAFSTGTTVTNPPPSPGGDRARSDFNGDGRADLLWQHAADGYLAAWTMNGTSLVSSDLLSPSSVGDTNWKIVGSGDFNSDGKPDLVWQEQTQGWVGVWLMNGRTLISSTTLSPSNFERVADTNWKIAAVVDINNDGKADILWQDQRQGWLAAWLLNGLSVVSSVGLNPERVGDTNWKIVGSGDFNGDGKKDLLWQDGANGYLAAWLMNGVNLVDSVLLSPNAVRDTNWRIVAVADFDADGKTDLAWQEQSQGWLAIWLMNGTSLKSSVGLSPERVPDTGWKIVGPR